MSKIKKFLDFITGYTSFNNKLNRMVNRDREVVVTNPSLSTDEILDLYSLIKDYLSSVGDIPGVSIMWQETEVGPNYVSMKSLEVQAIARLPMRLGGYNIEGLNSFRVQANLVMSDDVNFDEVLQEINSAKAQLESEDFKLEWEMVDMNQFRHVRDRICNLTIKHKSYNQPVPKRMRRAA
jgi:hypothetical protein